MNGRIIAAGAVVEPLSVVLPGEVTGEEIEALISRWVSWDMEVCYCSVFDRCWIADTEGGAERNRPAGGQCPQSETDIFEQLGLPAGD